MENWETGRTENVFFDENETGLPAVEVEGSSQSIKAGSDPIRVMTGRPRPYRCSPRNGKLANSLTILDVPSYFTYKINSPDNDPIPAEKGQSYNGIVFSERYVTNIAASGMAKITLHGLIEEIKIMVYISGAKTLPKIIEMSDCLITNPSSFTISFFKVFAIKHHASPPSC